MNSVDYYSKICSVKHMCIRENRREGEAMKKRCRALLLCFVMIAGLFVNVPMVAKAATINFDQKIAELKQMYPEGWVPEGGWDSYLVHGGYQCVAFSHTAYDYIYGSCWKNSPSYTNVNEIQKGDYIYYHNAQAMSGHAAIVMDVSGDKVTICSGNTYCAHIGQGKTVCYGEEIYKSSFTGSFGGRHKPNGMTIVSGNQNPVGHVDSISCEGNEIRVVGWAYDPDAVKAQLEIHVYAGGNADGTNRWFAGRGKATIDRGIGYWGFDIRIKTNLIGKQDVYVWALNNEGQTNGGSNVQIGSGTIDIKDNTKPIVSNMKIYNVSNKGYSVSCTVSDNVGVTQVKFPTWLPYYSEADLHWIEGTLNGNTATCYVRASDFTNESIDFYTDIRAWDAAGNMSDVVRDRVFIDQDKPVVSNIKIYNVSREGYSVSCTVSDNVGVTRVKFASWLPYYSEADIHETEGTINGNTATCYVRTADFTSESIDFHTDIRAYDAAGNASDIVRDKVFIDQNAPQISDIQITDENEEGYTISCKVTDDYSGVSKVCFLTQLTDADAASGWQNNANTQGTKEGDRYFFKVPFEDYDYENGKYTTTIYACDGFGNEKSIKYSHDVYGEIPEEDIPTGQPVPKGLWIAGVSPQTYTGKAIKPAVRVYDNNRLLVEKRDYSISYKNNVKANDASNEKAAPTITVTGKGNYTGKDSVTFSIMQKNIADADVSADNLILKANGKVQKPIPTLTYNGKKLVNKKDFTVTFPDVGDGAYKENGTYSVRISGIGNYTGSREATVTVTGAKMASKLTVGSIGKQLYTGEPIEPSLVVKDEKKVLKQGEDYTVSFENNKEVGTATATVAGIGNYAGTKKVTFKIVANASISSAQITMTTADGWNFVGSTYTGNEIRPDQYTVNVTIKGKENQTKTVTLKEGTDYTVSYQNNVNAGTATMLFKGINGYSGSQKKSYRITAFDMRGIGQDDPGVDVVLNGTYTYAKAGCMAKPTVLFGGSTLKEGRDYSLSYKNIAKVNDGSDQKKLPTVVIRGKGNFKGSIERTYQIAAEDLGNMTLTAKDIVWKNKAGIFKTRVVIKDQTGKTLNAGKDYETKLAYTYENDTTLKEDVIRRAGEEVQAKDILPAGTIIRVTASAKKGGGYQGTVSGTYRITSSDINKAVVKIPAQVYTGKTVKVDNVMQITMNGKPLSTDNYEIVSYSNNRNKGTASVTIKGKNDCGGIRTVKFKIKSKGFLWWWRS